MKTRLASIRPLYGFVHRLWRRHHRLITFLMVVGHLLTIAGWIMLVPPNSLFVEAVLIILISTWVFYPARLTKRKRWRIVLPVFTAVGLILVRIGYFDIVAAVFMLGALGLIAFIN